MLAGMDSFFKLSGGGKSSPYRLKTPALPIATLIFLI